ncbi:hypothetical protein AciX9_4637 (plasmid) [Granulicella tundricola MP5ACTX9]|uniref:Uncharacterized protein n=1 Tax=Granulicella tundricola (strain ATCC BAA-1859 / DSM 23138 / MP5ACTX9) TaxID=1198114 RepID=E8X7Y3_GRATM|nr:hypothetical protein AciX9_4637 [Granulicella tundricola MP5ACTX9]
MPGTEVLQPAPNYQLTRGEHVERLSRGEQTCTTAIPANLQSACQRPDVLLSYHVVLYCGRAARGSDHRSDAPVPGPSGSRRRSGIRCGGHKRADLRCRTAGAAQESDRTVLALAFFFVACFLMGKVSGAAGSLWSLEELLPRPAIKSSSETLKTSQRRSRERTEMPLPFSNPCQ